MLLAILGDPFMVTVGNPNVFVAPAVDAVAEPALDASVVAFGPMSTEFPVLISGVTRERTESFLNFAQGWFVRASVLAICC